MARILILLGLVSLVNAFLEIEINNPNPALDQKLYDEVLDAEQCRQQIDVLKRNLLLWLRFSDAGLKLPRGFTEGNFRDLGNYHQCLGIRHQAEDMEIQGKYCAIQVPSNQNFEMPWNIEWSDFDPTSLKVDVETVAKVKEYNLGREKLMKAMGIWDGSPSRSIGGQINADFNMATCIPKPCTTEQAITSLFFNISAIGFRYTDVYCRLPDDKPWSPADTVAVVFFSILGCLTVLNTSYDLYNTFYKKEQNKSNPLYTSFSVYTNGRRLMSFSSTPGTLHCVDGIRSLAMAWVVVGHSFATENPVANPFDSFTWMFSKESLWIMSAPITVDTFFCLAGVVLVYSTAGKMTGQQLIQNLPLFYLNRLLRLLPVLATAVLLQASFFNRISDGPLWSVVEDQTNYCRTTWWLTLLHVQNFINPTRMCFPHSWYIAIDVHAYLVSPLVLFWVLGKSRKLAWAALGSGLIAVLTAATIYNFINDFPSGIFQPNRPPQDGLIYMTNYYFNTLTRASPFFVGMIFGYLLHVLRENKMDLSWLIAATLWSCAAAVSTTIFFYPSFISDFEWDNQLVDNLMNSFMRPLWSAALCWMIVACSHGYGGPINWFLSLNLWRLPARISYAIFIFHYPLMFVINGSTLGPTYFSVPRYLFKFLAHLSLSIGVGYLVTLLIDAPFSTIFKQLLSSNKTNSVPKPVEEVRRPSTNDAKLDIKKLNESQPNINNE